MRIVEESLVTDHMPSEELYRIMISTPEFGDFNDYSQLDGMIVRTDIRPQIFGGSASLFNSRYWKFVQLVDGSWEVYEVDSNGVDLKKGKIDIY